MPITIYELTGQSLYVMFDDKSSTAVALTEGSGNKAGSYTAADSAIATAGLPYGTHSGRVLVGSAGSKNPADPMVWAIANFRWNGSREMAATERTPLDFPNLFAWHEPRLGGMYQDSAGTTTPVTSDNHQVGYVPDQSGNGNHATQSTSSNRPRYKPTGFNSGPCLLFEGPAQGNADGGNDFLALGNVGNSIFPYSSRTSVYVVYPTSVSDGYYALGGKAVGSNNMLFDLIRGTQGSLGARFVRHELAGSTGVGNGQIVVNTPYLCVVQHDRLLFGNGTTSSSSTSFIRERLWINGHLASDQTLLDSPWDTSGAWTLGSGNGGSYFVGNYALHATWSRGLTDDERDELGAYVTRNYGVPVARTVAIPKPSGNPVTILCIGDSNMRGVGQGGMAGPITMRRLLSDVPTTIYNIGISGLQAGQADTNVQSLLGPGDNIAFVSLGNNDLAGNQSAASTIAELQAVWLALRNLGFKVVAMEVPDRNASFSGGADTASYETARQTVNAAINQGLTDDLVDAVDKIGTDGTQVINGVTYNFSSTGGADAASGSGYSGDGVHISYLAGLNIGAAMADTTRVLVGPTTNEPARLAVGSSGFEASAAKLTTIDTNANTAANASATAASVLVDESHGNAALKTAVDAVPTLAELQTEVNPLNDLQSMYESNGSGGFRWAASALTHVPAVVWDAPKASYADAGSTGEALGEAGSGGGDFTDIDQEPAGDDRTFLLIPDDDDGLVGEKVKTLAVGTSPTFAVDFRKNMAVNSWIIQVDEPTIVDGEEGGITFGTRGRDKSLAKFRATGVTAGTYRVRVEVTYFGGATAAGFVTFKVVE